MSEQVLQSSSPRIDLHMGIKWLRGREEMKWTGGFTAWLIGKKKSGKSNGGELISVKCKNAGASTIFDTCASGDGENFAWLRSPYKDNILIVHGSGMKVTAPCQTMHVAEFNLKKCEKYWVVITNPALYRERRDYYTALAYIMDNHFMKRVVFSNSIVHLIREARKILAESEPTEFTPVYSPAYSSPVYFERVSLGQVAPLDSMRTSHRALAESIARALDEGAFDVPYSVEAGLIWLTPVALCAKPSALLI